MGRVENLLQVKEFPFRDIGLTDSDSFWEQTILQCTCTCRTMYISLSTLWRFAQEDVQLSKARVLII